jgi:DNA excision repair protein ERCC-6
MVTIPGNVYEHQSIAEMNSSSPGLYISSSSTYSSESYDSDYSPSKIRRKKNRKRLRQGTKENRKKRHESTNLESLDAKDIEEKEQKDESEIDIPDEESTMKKASTNWTDDGCIMSYTRRLQEHENMIHYSKQNGIPCFYYNPPSSEKFIEEKKEKNEFEDEAQDEESDTYLPQDVIVTESGLQVPKYVYSHLYPHQKECLEWLHLLHERNTGGILGDDMGLGKTVQIASFLGAMVQSGRVHVMLLACPASVLLQWVRELHKWYPPLRVVLLHGSGSGVTSAGRTYEQLVNEVTIPRDDERNTGGIIVTTYENLRQYQHFFMDINWDYVILDEGHRIRNPDAEITLVCKQLRTVHRIILTGTPIQNRLKELWSLFDFVYPGKLGTLPTFEDEFVLPIRTGGYASASRMQVVMAYKCALVLRDLIQPYMLRRTKKEIQDVTNIPEKKEQIIFCKLSDAQRADYQTFLRSSEVEKVLALQIRPFRAISILRHICNHTDLLSTTGQTESGCHSLSAGARRHEDPDFGSPERSGKMQVLAKILEIWKQQKHRVLIFTQTRKMLDILQRFVTFELGYSTCRLDGTTNVRERQRLLDTFNASDSNIFAFLLTTKAGGIGVNLVGADRVLIFDPDWNPSTDIQARERSWRIGQTKNVTIYRLITSGTIEEKIYHRQIFKQYLTNKVLHDPKRKRCFNRHSLRDLFVLTDDTDDQKTSCDRDYEGAGTETGDLFFAGHIPVPSFKEDTKSKTEEVSDPNLVNSLNSIGVRIERAEAIRSQVGDQGTNDDKEVHVGEEDEEKDEEKETEDLSTEDQENNYILKQLFDGCDVRGFFNHDAVESDGIQNQEADLIEMESEKIAQSALSTLRRSFSLIHQQRESMYTPTWTGRSGTAGDPNQRRGLNGRFGNRVGILGQRVQTTMSNTSSSSSSSTFINAALKSKEMLNKMRMRRNGVASSLIRLGSARPNGKKVDGTLSIDSLIQELYDFLANGHSSGVPTEDILDTFGSLIAPKDKMTFRNLLRSMATCQGRRWKLKKEYSF